MTRDEIIHEAKARLIHDYIIINALKQDDNLSDTDIYCDTITKIEAIEDTCTPDEISSGNLLCDIW